MPIVSILMNCHNCEKYVKEAIDSVYAQSFQDWEIIFVDNCSTDRSYDIAHSYDNRIVYVKTNELIPLGHARNFGLRHCQGKYVGFLDTDDLWLPNKLSKQIPFMEKSGYFMSYSSVIFIDESGNKIKTKVLKNDSGYIFPNLLKHNEINMQTVLIKNENLSFREDLSFSPDYNLFLKTSIDHNIGVIKQPLVKYRVHQNSLTHKTINKWGIEKQMTLDEVFENRPELKNKYLKEYKLAYAYAGQLKAKYFMHENRRLDAIQELYKHKFAKKSYFLLFLLGLMPKSLWDYVHIKLDH